MQRSPIKILGLMLVLVAVLAPPVVAHALTPEELAYSLGWDKGVVIVRYENQYGTGWWISKGFLVTAAHVVNNEKGAVVTVYKGSWRAKGIVVAVLDDRHGDVAIVEVEGHSMPPDAHVWELVPITNETLAQLKGRPLYVLGFPYELVALYGYDLSKASMNPRVAAGTFAWYSPEKELVEFAAITDAGNSGGPVVTEDGKVVGLVSYASVGEAGVMYFATSSNKVIALAKEAGVPIHVSMRVDVPSDEWPWMRVEPEHRDYTPYALGAAAGAAVMLAVALVARGGGRR